MLSSSLEAIVDAVREQIPAAAKEHESSLDKPSLYELFVESLHLAVDQVGRGVDPQEFRDHVVINFVIKADNEDYGHDETRRFLRNLSDEDLGE